MQGTNTLHHQHWAVEGSEGQLGNEQPPQACSLRALHTRTTNPRTGPLIATGSPKPPRCWSVAAGSSASPIPRGVPWGEPLRITGWCRKRSTRTPKPLPPGSSPGQTGEAVPGICTPRGNREGILMETGCSSGAGASVLAAQLNRDLQAETHPLPNTDWLYGRHHPFSWGFLFLICIKKIACKFCLPDTTQH